ncbi:MULTISPECIES: HyaD/HybD family hydrogenase maturation endopeptidase [unclassified Bradyrhizobium]|uniref:HyaD/HybD family hydrogenase maturation endopeptidase n=1 Tax=unclassified Bradyrhizobium TaxID=2631580 RepID=UPI00247B2A67|nr:MULTISPECIES: HyaD/HybD family hydrogenase maturation endopeptidase [unclassified Bradyrhizobium]WGR96272.1 HyaD/HybD family hydrogenase maturation endopeptidase [Bradyrhizobium sp. ISRA435]WGS02833.1 HyaD/HybD family hydrogenase maturation endopeptidase [Bradyrhizobium sp. ISRA436]WGS09719.1 HyaD/HybD family hydrogenase maturation endopeptidase [Bradyrhizobium sp. ISRA437]WGS16602.1 HyaD/HybD family hydrogenase maturation endopeptidase [Bradyrhizobium sp. ISRA443]WGS24044.1 HyaD/HybD famil
MAKPTNTRRILVLGIGNILWADEGFGVRAVEEFHRRYVVSENVTILEGGTQGLYLVNFLGEADCLIVFDAIDYGFRPGQLELVRGSDVPKFTAVKKLSLHQIGFQEVLSAAVLLGRCPRELALIGCQPLDLEDWGGPLTAPVRAQITPAIELACELLTQWGAPPKLRTRPLPASERLLANDIDHANYEMKGRPM